MRRREFLALVGGATAFAPLRASAQQTASPAVGFLSSQSPDTYAPFPRAFRKGLEEEGFIEGKDVTIQYRWARGRPGRLPALAADLVSSRVNVIAATGGVASVLAAKAATALIPIVFNSGEDPVQAGLVSSFNRPGVNVTGVSWFSVDTGAKRLAILHRIVPAAAVIAYLANPKDPEDIAQLPLVTDAAHELGVSIVVVRASTPAEIDGAFTALVEQGARAVLIAPGAFFVNQRTQLVALAAKHSLPCMYDYSTSIAAGGLISYGNDLQDAYRRNEIMSDAFLRGRNRANYQLTVPRSSSWRSISRRPRRSASQSRLRFLRLPIR